MGEKVGGLLCMRLRTKDIVGAHTRPGDRFYRNAQPRLRRRAYRRGVATKAGYNETDGTKNADYNEGKGIPSERANRAAPRWAGNAIDSDDILPDKDALAARIRLLCVDCKKAGIKQCATLPPRLSRPRVPALLSFGGWVWAAGTGRR